MSKIISIKPVKKLSWFLLLILIVAKLILSSTKALEKGVFTIIIVWGGALDAYSYFIAEA